MKYKISTLCFFFTLFTAGIFAQATLKTQMAAGGHKSDYFTCMDLTKDGGAIAGGYSSSNRSGEKSEDCYGDYDYWIIKYNNKGAIEWDKTFGSTAREQLSSIRQTSDNGYILAGWSSDWNNINGMWVIKLDASGNIQWDKIIASTAFSAKVIQTKDKGYVLCVTESGLARDYRIIKMDSGGNITWDKNYGGSGEDYASSIIETSDGGYAVAGYSNSGISGDKSEDSKGLNDYWILKLNSNGEKQWDKTAGGSSYDEGLSITIQQTRSDGYIIGGISMSDISGDKTENNRGAFGTSDYWVVKLNATGTVEWDKTIGTVENETFSDLDTTAGGGYILAGYTAGNISGEKTENSRGDLDYWIVKLDHSGNIQWDKTLGGSGPDWLISVREIKRNFYLLGGDSYSPVSGDKTRKMRGRNGFDYWLLTTVYKKPLVSLTDSAAVEASAKDKNSFNIYPNPAKYVLHIQTTGTSIFSLTTATGKVIVTKEINGKGDINIGMLKTGIYFLRNITTGAMKKVVVQN